MGFRIWLYPECQPCCLLLDEWESEEMRKQGGRKEGRRVPEPCAKQAVPLEKIFPASGSNRNHVDDEGSEMVRRRKDFY